MKNKYNIFFSIVFLLFGIAQGFTQENEYKKKEKINQLLQRFSDLSYGQWKSMSGDFRGIGDTIIEPLMKILRKEEYGEGAWRRIEWNQRGVAWILGEVRTERAIDLLIDILQDTTIHVWGRIEAAEAVGRIKTEKAVEPLIVILNNKESEPVLRREAGYALGDIQSERAVVSLIKALKENNIIINMGAIYALGHIGSDKAVEALIDALDYADGYVRGQIYSNLRRLQPEREHELLFMALEDELWGAREDAVEALLEIGEPVYEHLIKILSDIESSCIARWETVRILGIINSEKFTEPLIEALRDEEWMVRNEAAVALSRINSDKAAELLIVLLKDKNSYVREEAAWILGEIKSEKAVEPLISVLDDKECGWMTALALGKIQSEKAVEPLINLLKNENIKVRRAALWSLGKIQSEKAAKSLIKALKDEDSEIRILAIIALEKIGTPKKLKAIEKHKKQNK